MARGNVTRMTTDKCGDNFRCCSCFKPPGHDGNHTCACYGEWTPGYEVVNYPAWAGGERIWRTIEKGSTPSAGGEAGQSGAHGGGEVPPRGA